MKLFYSKETHIKLERKLWVFEILVVMICLLISSYTQAQNLEFAKNIIDVPNGVLQEFVTTDDSGNIYVGGRFYGDQTIDFDPSASVAAPLDPGGFGDNDSHLDLFVAKYNSTGDFQWVITCQTNGSTTHGNDPLLDLAGFKADASGNLYIAGDITGGNAYWTFSDGGFDQITGQSTGIPASDWTQPFILSVDSDGEERWITNPNAIGTELEVNDIDLYGSNVYIVGRYNGSFIGLPDDGFPSNLVIESYIASYNQSTGSLVDSERLLHTSVVENYANEINALEIDPSGNFYVTGTFKNSTDFNPGAGSAIISGNSDGSSFIAKYQSDFTYEWVRNEDNIGYDVKRAPNGYVWMVRSDDTHTRVLESWNSAGNKSATVVNLSYATNSIWFDSNGDFYTWDFIKIDGLTGSQIYDNGIGGVNYVDGNDKVYLTSKYENTGIDFDLGAGILRLGSGDFSDDVQLSVYNNETDNTAPVLVSVSPADGSNDVDVATNLVLTFNEPVRPVSNTASILNQLIVRNKSTHAAEDIVYTFNDEVSYSGNVITIDLDTDLPDDTEMYITLQEGFAIDYAGNGQAAITSSTEWEINTGAEVDVTAPSIVSVSPVDEATGVSVFTDLVVNFDEDIQKGTGIIYVRRIDNNAVVKSIDVSSSDVTISGSQLTVDLPDKLLLNTNVYVQLITGIVEDLSGNDVVGISGETWDFTTEAASPPQISSLSPADDGTGVAVSGQTFTITWDETVTEASGFARINQMNGTMVESFTDFVVSGSQTSFTSTVDLDYNTDYYITVNANSFQDAVGSSSPAISGSTTWNFTTEPSETVAPTVSALSPEDNATGVPTSTDTYTITFSEDVQVNVGTSQIWMYRASDDVAVSGLLAGNTTVVDVTNNVVTIEFTGLTLVAGTEYYIVVLGDAFEDLNGNAFAGISKPDWSFTASSGDVTPPSVSSLSPTDNATDVAIDQTLTINFNESIQKGTGTISIHRVSDDLQLQALSVSTANVVVSGSSATITPPVDFPFDTELYVSIPSGTFEDLAGNDYPGLSGTIWSFTTEPEAFDVVSFSTVDNSAAVAIDADFTITFNANANIGAGTIGIYRTSDDVLVTSLSNYVASNMTISGASITFDFPADLDYEENYYIQVTDNYLRNTTVPTEYWSGIQDTFTWNFTTEDNPDSTPPTTSSLSPTDNSTEVALDANLVITFNEDIQKGSSGIINIKRSSDDLVLQAFGTGSSSVTVSGNTATINPVDFNAGVEMYVEVPSGFFEDLAGNDFTGIAEPDWSFTTNAGDVTAPSISTLSPTNGATDVSITNWVFTIDFDEDIQNGAGIIRLRKSSDNTTFTTALIGTPLTSISGSELTIDFNAQGTLDAFDLNYETDYYIEIPSNAVQDLAGNPFAGTGISDWEFTTEVEPFGLVSLIPADNSSNVSVGADLAITFNQDASIGSGNIRIYRSSDDGLVSSLSNFNGSYMAISGPTITFDFPSDLPQGEELYVHVSDGYLRSDANSLDTWEGIQDNTSWTFTVEDNRPQITGFTPTTEKGSGEVIYEITFDRDIALTTLTNRLFRVFTSSAVQVVSMNRYGDIEIDGNTATLKWQYPLSPDVDYYVNISEGFFVDATDSNNGAEGIDDNTTWTFSTRANDGNGPSIVSLSPANGEEKVLRSGSQVDFVMTFDEPVYLGNTSGEVLLYRDDASGDVLYYNVGNIVSISEDNLSVTFDIPDGYTMLADTEYYILFDTYNDAAQPNLFDADGNGIADITSESTWRFRTYGPVEILSLSPADEATDVPVDAVFTITTNNDLSINGGTIRIRNYETGGIARTIILPSPDVTVSGNQASFNFNSFGDLAEGWHYYIDIGSAVFLDEFNQTFTIAGNETWDFTTEIITIVWDGSSWNNGTGPTSNDNVRLEGNYSGGFECEDLTVNPGVTLTVNNNETLHVYDDITNSGSIVVESGSSLITYDGAGYTGNDITIKRNTRYGDGKYSFVGTPVQSDAAITGSDLGSTVYSYDESVAFGADGINRWINASSEQLTPGKGYVQAFQQELVFAGQPNSGSISHNGTYTEDTNDADEGWNLVSNPYPAAIEVDAFLTANTNILGAVYLWDDNNSESSRGSNSDYIVANAIGVTSNSQAGNGSRYNNHILSSQGFFVKLLNGIDTDIDFSEAMRVTGNNADDNFFRETNSSFKLSLTNNEGLYKETLMGFVEDADQDVFNRLYDAPVFNREAANSIFSIKFNESLAIQGLSYNSNNILIGIKIEKTGYNTISMSEYNHQEIYLRDLKTGELTLLNSGGYTFYMEAGMDKNRFEIAINPSVITSSITTRKAQIYAAGKQLFIKSGTDERREIKVVSISGQSVYEDEIEGSISFDLQNIPSGMYIVRETVQGQIFTHKVMFK
ncbi:MAG: Ig-like domain-containing protein [bacterium]|nr:Ig-like domain-containing protein [bacterium]